jgi:uncharacterized membrane protein YgcG
MSDFKCYSPFFSSLDRHYQIGDFISLQEYNTLPFLEQKNFVQVSVRNSSQSYKEDEPVQDDIPSQTNFIVQEMLDMPQTPDISSSDSCGGTNLDSNDFGGGTSDGGGSSSDW